MPTAAQIQRVDRSLLYPPFFDRWCLVLDRCAARGAYYFMQQGTRTYAEQANEYAIGRTVQNRSGKPEDAPGTGPHGLGRPVTNARPGQGAHNFGMGGDSTHSSSPDRLIPDWEEANYHVLAEELAAAGLISGSGFRDWPHGNMPGFSTGSECAEWASIYERTPGDLPTKLGAVWASYAATGQRLPDYPANDAAQPLQSVDPSVVDGPSNFTPMEPS